MLGQNDLNHLNSISASRPDDLLIGRRRHARFPILIAQLDAVAARIEHEELPAGEKAAGTVIHRLVDFNAEVAKQLARVIEHLRADIERVVQAAILFHRPVNRTVAFAQENIVVAELETGHRRVGQPADMFQAENLALEMLRLFEIIHRDRPMNHRIKF